MKILQINKFFYLKGGSERYFFDVSDALGKAGHDVIHFSMADEKNRPSPYSDHFIRNIDFTKKRGIRKAGHYVYSLEAMEEVRRLVKITKPDVAHLHNISHQLTPSIIVALRNAGVPVVQTLHDYQLICPNYKLFTQGAPCEKCFKHKYWNAIRLKCIQDSAAASALGAFEMGFHNVLLQTYKWGVHRFIAPSQFMEAKLLDWGWQKNQVDYLPHFVTKDRPASPKRKNQVVFVGRLSSEKGADLLLEAAEQFTEMDILFVGEGEERAVLEKQAKEKGLKHVQFLGFKEGKELDKIMTESQAVVVPSRWYENAPMVVYEALALGVPVIGAKHGGLVELIDEGKTGYLFTPSNAEDLVKTLKKLHNDPLVDLPENRFPEADHIRALEELYVSVQGERKSKMPI